MRQYVCLSLCLCLLLFFLHGCNQTEQIEETADTTPQINTEKPIDNTQLDDDQSDGEYYTLSDFADIVIGESTVDDVIEKVPPPESMKGAAATSYGFGLYYPAKNNSTILVAFNDDWVVIDISSYSEEEQIDSFADYMKNPQALLDDLQTIAEFFLEDMYNLFNSP